MDFKKHQKCLSYTHSSSIYTLEDIMEIMLQSLTTDIALIQISKSLDQCILIKLCKVVKVVIYLTCTNRCQYYIIWTNFSIHPKTYLGIESATIIILKVIKVGVALAKNGVNLQ